MTFKNPTNLETLTKLAKDFYKDYYATEFDNSWSHQLKLTGVFFNESNQFFNNLVVKLTIKDKYKILYIDEYYNDDIIGHLFADTSWSLSFKWLKKEYESQVKHLINKFERLTEYDNAKRPS